MYVSTRSALPLVLLLVACSYASPMFGMGGMMKRKFPGAPDMTYQTYRGIANSNAAAAAAASGAAAGTGGAAAVPRTGGSGAGDTAWMFGNVLGDPSVPSSNQPGSFTQSGLSFDQQQPSFDQQQPSSIQQQPSFDQQQASFSQQQPSFNQQQPSFNQPQPFFNQHEASYNQQGLPFYPQDFQATNQGRYPSVWDPRESYAPLQFPYHGHAPLDYDEMLIAQNKIYSNYH